MNITLITGLCKVSHWRSLQFQVFKYFSRGLLFYHRARAAANPEAQLRSCQTVFQVCRRRVVEDIDECPDGIKAEIEDLKAQIATWSAKIAQYESSREI